MEYKPKVINIKINNGKHKYPKIINIQHNTVNINLIIYYLLFINFFYYIMKSKINNICY